MSRPPPSSSASSAAAAGRAAGAPKRHRLRERRRRDGVGAFVGLAGVEHGLRELADLSSLDDPLRRWTARCRLAGRSWLRCRPLPVQRRAALEEGDDLIDGFGPIGEKIGSVRVTVVDLRVRIAEVRPSNSCSAAKASSSPRAANSRTGRCTRPAVNDCIELSESRGGRDSDDGQSVLCFGRGHDRGGAAHARADERDVLCARCLQEVGRSAHVARVLCGSPSRLPNPRSRGS